MNYSTLAIVTVILMVFVCQSETNTICYKAKTCMHDTKERCGVDEDGNARRFLDTCDLLEYNCYYNATYVKVPDSDCDHLAPLDKDEFTEKNK